MDKLQNISGYFNLFVGVILLLYGIGAFKMAANAEAQEKFRTWRVYYVLGGIAIVFWGLIKLF